MLYWTNVEPIQLAVSQVITAGNADRVKKLGVGRITGTTSVTLWRACVCHAARAGQCDRRQMGHIAHRDMVDGET